MISIRTVLATGLALTASLTFTPPASAANLACLGSTTDVLKRKDPGCFKAHNEPAVHALLIHYGSAMSQADLDRIKPVLIQRFAAATGGALTLDLIDSQVIPLAAYNRDLKWVANQIPGGPEQHSPARLTRLWYYYQTHLSLPDEIHSEMLRARLGSKMAMADAVLVLSEAQFDGLGYEAGAFAITKQPMEIAWAAGTGGETRFEPDARLIDELIHELGHVLGLTHPSQQCEPTLPVTAAKLAQRAQCCQESPSGTDVMSYCRNRDQVTDSFFYGYKDCTRGFLQGMTVPALIYGGKRPLQAHYCP